LFFLHNLPVEFLVLLVVFLEFLVRLLEVSLLLGECWLEGVCLTHVLAGVLAVGVVGPGERAVRLVGASISKLLVEDLGLDGLLSALALFCTGDLLASLLELIERLYKLGVPSSQLSVAEESLLLLIAHLLELWVSSVTAEEAFMLVVSSRCLSLDADVGLLD